MSTSVTIERAGAVATVSVCHPPVNALADDVLIGLTAAAEQLGSDDGVRAVVLTGDGERSFIAGADLGVLTPALGPEGGEEAMLHHVSLTGPMFAAWSQMPQPAVAALGGHAVGGGLEIALVCDFIVADPRVRLGQPEIGLGLIPGAGGTQRLPRRIGLPVARRMLMTGELIAAPDAHEIGLVDVVSAEGEALAEAQALATRLAAMPARAMQAAKLALKIAQTEPLADGLARERDLFLEVAASSDAREGADAFLGKRSPEFRHC